MQFKYSDLSVRDDISIEIDNHHLQRFISRGWNRLRPGELGHDCERHIWSQFRCVTKPKSPPGRILRLFGRGHTEEYKMVENLKAIGFNVLDVDENTGKQWAVPFLENGHGFGYTDGVLSDSKGRLEGWLLLEVKSHSERSFKDLQKRGVEVAHRKHYAQMQLYMKMQQLPKALYAAMCKNDESTYFEVIVFNDSYAERLLEKGIRLTSTDVAPHRISLKADSMHCRFCSDAPTCHGSEPAQRNCRTCIAVSVESEGRWKCTRENTFLTYDEQMRGCSSQRYLPSLINGKQVSTSEAQIVYELVNGQAYIDRGPGA
jgi:hypothetical protein